ncbi:kell blood group glycoprotein homolog [Drosophila pseudoobscura]|uniref:Kell blood group glycoprotein homolog n=1 Tax=Drosophila pseudoobscura pseudoobscura TaxID=46245 RepID=A0A6I8UI61_DROPS|nr:kell blood group glycoprotein homolog [Drosophila pseudoobscura]
MACGLRIISLMLLSISIDALPTYHLNQSCPYQSQCDPSINWQHIRRLESYVRRDVDPCVDFYAYACGNWRRIHGEGGTATTMSEAQINQRFEDLFLRLLQDPLAQEHGYPMQQKLLTHYQSCTALTSPNLRRYLQLLPPLPPLNASHWMELVSILGRYGYHDHFVQIEVRHHNISQHMIFIQPHNHNQNLDLTREIYDALPHNGVGFAQLKEMFSVLESHLNRLAKPNITDDSFHNLTLEQIRRRVPELDWLGALKRQLNRSSVNADHSFQVDELSAIRQVILYLNRQDRRLLNLYSLARFLSHLLQLPHNPLESLSSALVSSKSLSIACIRHMRRTLYLPMIYAYERVYYAQQRPSDERVIHSVFTELKDQLVQTLDQNNFNLDRGLVKALQTKVLGMRLNVGNVPRNVTEDFFWATDRNWKVGHDFHENHLNSLLYYYSLTAELEGNPDATEKAIWYSFNNHSPDLTDNIDATPYFYCLGNIIIIPYSYAQLPFYHSELWPAMLYGDLANTLGHEMLHAFDTDLVDYDVQGNMRDYSEQLQQQPLYVEAVKCLNDSSVVLNERTSDVSGSRLAFRTYMKDTQSWQSNGRYYFLQFSHFFCGDEGDRYHDMGSTRLNYALSQMPEFATYFHCARGTPMNSAKQCQFW